MDRNFSNSIHGHGLPWCHGMPVQLVVAMWIFISWCLCSLRSACSPETKCGDDDGNHTEKWICAHLFGHARRAYEWLRPERFSVLFRIFVECRRMQSPLVFCYEHWAASETSLMHAIVYHFIIALKSLLPPKTEEKKGEVVVISQWKNGQI